MPNGPGQFQVGIKCFPYSKRGTGSQLQPGPASSSSQEDASSSPEQPGTATSSQSSSPEQPGAAASSQQQPAAARSSFGSQNVDFSFDLIRKTRFRPTKYQYFIGFIRFSKNKVAVAAAAWCDPPPHCSHSNFIFADVDISNVLATFCADVAHI